MNETFNGNPYATRKEAARFAWQHGYREMHWEGLIYRVKDQGRKVERTGLFARKHPTQDARGTEITV